MVAYFDLGGAGPNMFDESSHGSHTAGSVDGDQPPFGTYTGNDGLAPAAMHVHQNIADGGGGLGGLPDNYYDLFRQAYEPRNPAQVEASSGANGNVNGYCTLGTGSCRYKPLEDARTHSNSYGLLAPVVDDGEADLLDEFVWDHEDMTISVAAGNAGPVPASAGTPSVAKNNLSSGAGANGREPMTSIDSVASFSSHGPTGDGRLGVTVITPGQIVVSVKGGSTDGYHVAQGTSMSTPVLSGLATLVRQYYWDGFAAANLKNNGTAGGGFAAGTAGSTRQHNPSAALVRATLINGAVRMRGWYTGVDGDNRALDGQWPSEGQGFGRVNLDNSLYFANDPSNLWYMDVYRADTTGGGSCTAAGGVGTSDCTSFPLGVNASRNFRIHVEPGQPLDVSLAWTDFSSGLAAGSPALVNNLNLTVTGPGGTTYVGNNMNSRANAGVAVAETLNAPGNADTKNNNERVRVANPAAGDYTIAVSAPAVIQGNQGFALVASGNISKVGGPAFAPGPALQVDQAGSPTLSNVKVTPISANTAKVTFDTSEPTTATATLTLSGGSKTFVDSYNIGAAADWPGLNIGPVETSADYANKPVLGKSHEILIVWHESGPGLFDRAQREVTSPTTTVAQTATLDAPSAAFQADAARHRAALRGSAVGERSARRQVADGHAALRRRHGGGRRRARRVHVPHPAGCGEPGEHRRRGGGADELAQLDRPLHLGSAAAGRPSQLVGRGELGNPGLRRDPRRGRGRARLSGDDAQAGRVLQVRLHVPLLAAPGAQEHADHRERRQPARGIPLRRHGRSGGRLLLDGVRLQPAFAGARAAAEARPVHRRTDRLPGRPVLRSRTRRLRPSRASASTAASPPTRSRSRGRPTSTPTRWSSSG